MPLGPAWIGTCQCATVTFVVRPNVGSARDAGTDVVPPTLPARTLGLFFTGRTTLAELCLPVAGPTRRFRSTGLALRIPHRPPAVPAAPVSSISFSWSSRDLGIFTSAPLGLRLRRLRCPGGSQHRVHQSEVDLKFFRSSGVRFNGQLPSVQVPS